MSVCVSGRATLVEQERVMICAILDTVQTLRTTAEACFAARIVEVLVILLVTYAKPVIHQSTVLVQSVTITVLFSVSVPTLVRPEDVWIPATRP